MHSYAFTYKEGRVFEDLEGVFWGREGGVAIYENLGFPVSKPGVSQSQACDSLAIVLRLLRQNLRFCTLPCPSFP